MVIKLISKKKVSRCRFNIRIQLKSEQIIEKIVNTQFKNHKRVKKNLSNGKQPINPNVVGETCSVVNRIGQVADNVERGHANQRDCRVLFSLVSPH